MNIVAYFSQANAKIVFDLYSYALSEVLLQVEHLQIFF